MQTSATNGLSDIKNGHAKVRVIDPLAPFPAAAAAEEEEANPKVKEAKRKGSGVRYDPSMISCPGI